MLVSDVALCAESIAVALRQGGGVDLAVEVFDVLPSTNRHLAAKAGEQVRAGKGIEGPVLCATNQQTHGVGRRGKSWVSSAGSITFSMMQSLPLRAEQLMGLSLVVGVSVAGVLQSLTDERVQVKWPNDILIGDKKVSGLLVELQPGMGANSTVVIVGIGINYHETAALASLGIGGTNLHAHAVNVPDRNALIGALGVALLQNVERFVADGWGGFTSQWGAVDYLAGREVRVLRQNGEMLGRAEGVDGRGALLVRPVDPDADVQTVVSGEVSVRPV